MHLFNYNPYSIVNEHPIAKIDAGCNRPIASTADLAALLSFSAGSLQVGGADRDRTDDPLLAKQVLSQLSYSPEGLKGGLAALLDICRLLVWTPWNGEVVLERR